jgi:hypothetical protein
MRPVVMPLRVMRRRVTRPHATPQRVIPLHAMPLHVMRRPSKERVLLTCAGEAMAVSPFYCSSMSWDMSLRVLLQSKHTPFSDEAIAS